MFGLIESGVVVAVTERGFPTYAGAGLVIEKRKIGIGQLWDGSVLTDPARSSKQVRDEALEALDYTFADGAIIQTRPRDEAVMRNAIDIMTREGVPSIAWVMKNNAKRQTTAAELTEALHAGQLAAMQVWNNYEPELIE